jgi:hypothetical protein
MSRNSDSIGVLSAAEILQARFKRRPVLSMVELCKAVAATERTVARALKETGYLSSYSHAGKYYTLQSIPSFDTQGLWLYRNIGFSKHGTLRATIGVLVKEALAGHTHEELQAILQLRVHDTLRDLVRAGIIGREQVDAVYVYVAADPKVARAQVAKRLAVALTAMGRTEDRVLDLACVVEILLIVIRRQQASTAQIRSTLGTKGIIVTDREIDQVLDQYGLKKKRRGSSPSRRSNA